MAVVTTKTFRSGNSQAVRLPREIAYEDDTELTVVRSGDVITMYPKPRLSISEMLDRLNAMPGPPSVENWREEELDERET